MDVVKQDTIRRNNLRGPLPGGAGLVAIGILAAVLAFSFQGSRGIWEPDEGFYVNVAMHMVKSGDWLVPRLNGLPFLDKPPLNYWGMAAGMRVFGIQEWGARFAQALWFIGAVLLVGALGRRLHGPPAGQLASLIYASSLLPFLAANIVTSDTPLAFCSVLAFYCYWRTQAGPGTGQAGVWWTALGAAAGLGILAKGPAMLIFLAPMVLHFLWFRGLKRALLCPWAYVSIALALAIGGSWFVLIATRVPGAAAYFVDNEAVGRLVTTTYHRNEGLAGGLRVYAPSLLLGSLPWSLLWPYMWWRRRSSGQTPFWRGLGGRSEDLLLTLWIGFPLVVLFAASSRLVLYSLPLFAPMAIGTARMAEHVFEDSAVAARPRLVSAAFALWCLFLIAGKGITASMPNEHDSRAIARGIEARLGTKEVALVSLNDKLNGLPFYGFSNFEWVTIKKGTYPFFTPLETLPEHLAEHERSREPQVFLLPRSRMRGAAVVLARANFSCRDRGAIEKWELLECNPPAAPATDR